MLKNLASNVCCLLQPMLWQTLYSSSSCIINRTALCLFFFVKSTVVCTTEPQMGYPTVKHTGNNPTGASCLILRDLQWKCSSSPKATGPPPLFHGYLDTHSPEWRHAAMNPGICDPATDRHSSATDSIKLQIKAGTSKGLWGGSMEMWQWEGERKWVRGEKRKKKKEAHLRNPWTWQSLIQINICEWWSVVLQC